MLTEQSLQEQAFKTYLELEAEELRQLCEELKNSVKSRDPDGYKKSLCAIRDFVNKRVSVIKEADALFKAVQFARERANHG